jgi:hypothetical protein
MTPYAIDPVANPKQGQNDAMSTAENQATGINALIADVSRHAAQATPGWWGKVQFVLQISEAYAFIRLRDIYHPLRFVKQLVSAPPSQFGTTGFRADLVEEGDENPARHYTAFVFIGFWLPGILAHWALWGWEILGYLRYHFHWSPEDMRVGRLGIAHGRLVQRFGPTILPSLIARDLAATGDT